MDEVVAAAGPWTPPLPWLPGAPPFRLALRPGPAPDWREAVPGGCFARSVLAAPAEAGDRRGPWALRFLLDAPAPPIDDPFGVRIDNRTLAAGLAGPGAVPGAADAPLAATGATPLPPTSYCPVRGVLFRAFCPDTLEPLASLRDEALLAELGLESHGDSLVRYEAAVAAGNRPRRVYTWSLDGGAGAKDGVQVRRRAELFTDYGELLQRELDPTQQDRLARQFPCWTCPERSSCFAAGQAPQRLLPLNYHESPAVLAPCGELPFEALVAMLGGASVAAQLADRQVPGREAVLAALDAPAAWLTPLAATAAASGPEWLAQWAREVAYVKLGVFEQLVTVLAAAHAATGRPLLDLSPARVWARPAEACGVAPARWAVELHLTAVDPPVFADVDRTALGSVPALAAPLPGDEPWCRSPWVDAGTFRGVARGTARVEPDGDDALRVDFSAPHTRFQDLAVGDVVVLAPGRPLPGTGTRHLVGSLMAVAAGKLTLRVAGSGLAKGGRTEVPAEAVTYHRYGTGCDLWALAQLLAQLLAGHDQRDAAGTDELVRSLVAKCERTASRGSLEDAVRTWLAAAVPEGSRALLHDAEARAALPEPPVVEAVWGQLWTLVLQLAATSRGCGFADSRNSQVPWLTVVERVRALRGQLRIEAFGAEPRRRELAAAIGAMLRELDAPAAPPGAGS